MSLKRIQSFLLAEEIEKPSRANREQVGVTVSHGDFYWSEVESNYELNCRLRYRLISKNNRRSVVEAIRRLWKLSRK